MKRWALLEHTVKTSNIFERHFDFLLEYGDDCLTWKLLEIPIINGEPVKIFQQINHRSIWLTRESYQLSRNRGFVQRKDHGTYQELEDNFNIKNFSVVLEGIVLSGLFEKRMNFCKLISMN